jgi:hypothetical protein
MGGRPEISQRFGCARLGEGSDLPPCPLEGVLSGGGLRKSRHQYWPWKRVMTDRAEELRETAAQCLALAQSTTDPKVRAALTMMAQKLYDVVNYRSAEYEVAQREFNDRQMLQQFPVEQPQSTMQQQQQIQSKKEK